MRKKRKIALYGLLHLAVLFAIIYLAMNTIFAQESIIEIQSPLSQKYYSQINSINYSLDSQLNFSNCWAIIQEEKTEIFPAGESITGISSLEGINNWLLICNDSQNNIYQKEIIFSSIFSENETNKNQTFQELELEIISPLNSLYNSSQLLLEINFSNNTNKWDYELSNLDFQEFNSSIQKTNLTRLNTGDYVLTITIYDEFENFLNKTIEFQIDFDDLDRDSVLDFEDNLILSKELIQTNFDLKIKVNGEQEIPALLNENETLIEFYDDSNLILSIMVNDSNQTIDLQNLILNKFDYAFSIKGFEYSQETYFNKLEGQLIKICVNFENDSSPLGITNRCSSNGEFDFTRCIGSEYTLEEITCKDLDNKFMFKGNFSALNVKFVYLEEEEEVSEKKETVVREESFQEVFFNENQPQEETVLELESINDEEFFEEEIIEEEVIEETYSIRNIAPGKVIETLEQIYSTTDKKWIIIALSSLGLIGILSIFGFRKKKKTFSKKIPTQEVKDFDEKFKAK